jgi:Flp pilus assembly protein TadD
MRRHLRLLPVALLLLVGCAGRLGESRNDTFEARKRLTHELVGRQEWTGAFFYADQLHRERPKDAEVLVLRGIVFRERGLPDDAQRDLEEALRLAPRLAEAHAALGILFDSTGRGEQADRHHRQATGIDPENPVFLNNLGFSLYLRKRHAEAIETFQRGVRLNPVDRRLRTNLGFAYAASGDLPRASREFGMGGTPAEAKNNLGFAYEQRGDLGNAFSLYLEALRLNPQSGPARANLIHVAKLLGKELPPEAREERTP